MIAINRRRFSTKCFSAFVSIYKNSSSIGKGRRVMLAQNAAQVPKVQARSEEAADEEGKDKAEQAQIGLRTGVPGDD